MILLLFKRRSILNFGFVCKDQPIILSVLAPFAILFSCSGVQVKLVLSATLMDHVGRILHATV